MPALAVALAALTLGVGSCGGNDDDGEGAGQVSPAASSGAGGSGDRSFEGREAEVNEALEGIQQDFVDVDGASYCDRLTGAGIRQVERFGEAFGYGSECAQVIDSAAKATRDAGVEQKPTKLISVEFKGDRAVATVRNGKRPPEPMVFIKEGGDWKVPNPGFQAKVGGEIDTPPLSSDPDKRLKQVKRTHERIEKLREGR